jgi:hypothetical protein
MFWSLDIGILILFGIWVLSVGILVSYPEKKIASFELVGADFGVTQALISLKLTSPFISPIYLNLDVTFVTVPGFWVQKFRVHIEFDPLICKHCDLPRQCHVTTGGKTRENNLKV